MVKNEMVSSTKNEQIENGMSNNETMIDYTEFVKHLGREYGEMVYEAVETPEDLRSTIDWADTNFFESDSLNYMLEDVESTDIQEYFENMEWEEYRKYEDIFVEAAKERMEEILWEWKHDIADDIVVKCSSDIENICDEIEEEMGNIYTSYGYIKEYDDLENLDAGSRCTALKKLLEYVEEAQWKVEACYEEISEVLEADVTAADGFFVRLPMMHFFGWYHAEIENCDYDPVETLENLHNEIESDYNRSFAEVYEAEVER